MKLKSILLGLCCLISFGGNAQVLENGNLVVPHKKGDPRVKPRDIVAGFSLVADEIEAWRENPDSILAELGEDLDWLEDKKKAAAGGGHVVEAIITPGETAELCMLPADASKVTHLKLTGRAMKWGAYGPDDLNLTNFLRTMKNLKVLNLRDLDCEIIYLDNLNRVEKIVLPANCTNTRVIGNNNLKQLVMGPRFEAFGYVIYETDKKSYQVEMTRNFLDMALMKEFQFPEGVVYIGGFTFGKGTQSVTFPSTLKVIENFGNNFAFDPKMEIPSLKEIHVNSNIPPVVRNFPFKYEHLKDVTLYIPKGAKSNYMKDLNWRNFGSIVEEDVVIAERPIDEDLIIVKPAKESHIGKWKFAKSEITDLDGNNRKLGADPGLDYMVLDGKIWHDFKKDGSTVQNKYQFIDNSIFLGTTVFHVDKVDDKELILSAIFMARGKGYKSIFTFERME